jgi:hypothetical protein
MLAFMALNVFADESDKIKSPSTTASEMKTTDAPQAAVYVFESGSQAIGYKYFVRAEIHNDYGIGVEANGETCFKGSKKTIFDDHVILRIDNYATPKVYWSVESSVLKVYITQ